MQTSTAKVNFVNVEHSTSIKLEPKSKEIRPLAELIEEAQAKIRQDLFRFRTCCADPRASK